MPVEIFTTDQFDAALPHVQGKPLARTSSFEDGQWTYMLPVANGMAIKVYSGIGSSGVSADCGEDSIRAVIVRLSDGRVYGSKLKRWVTRQPGWRARLTDMLREMWKLALLTGPCNASIVTATYGDMPYGSRPCGGTIGVYLVRKPGPNKGRMFRKCDGDKCKVFEWLVKDDKGALRKEAA